MTNETTSGSELENREEGLFYGFTIHQIINHFHVRQAVYINYKIDRIMKKNSKTELKKNEIGYWEKIGNMIKSKDKWRPVLGIFRKALEIKRGCR